MRQGQQGIVEHAHTQRYTHAHHKYARIHHTHKQRKPQPLPHTAHASTHSGTTNEHLEGRGVPAPAGPGPGSRSQWTRRHRRARTLAPATASCHSTPPGAECARSHSLCKSAQCPAWEEGGQHESCCFTNTRSPLSPARTCSMGDTHLWHATQ